MQKNWKIGKLENWKIGKFKFLNNKQLAVLVTVAFATPYVCVAKKNIVFEYDGFGNRRARYVENCNNSTKSFVFDEEDPFLLDVPEVVDESKNSISVYPNPTADYLYVDIVNLENCNYQLSNINGVVLEKAKLQENVIDLSQYVQGVYHLIIENGDVKGVFRIVKK